MKKRLFSIMAIGAIALTSCKKEEVLDSNQLGEATINGNIFADLDETNDVNAAGIFTLGSNPEKVEGMTVTVTIDTEDWDQSPEAGYAYPMKTYTATTDANGDYTLTIPTTDVVKPVQLVFGQIFTTQNKYTTDGSALTQDVTVGGNTVNVSIFAGAVQNVSHKASVNATNGIVNNEYGTAKLRVKLKSNVDYGPNSTLLYDTLTGSSLLGQTVEFTYNQSYLAPDNTYNNSSVFTATIVEDPTNPTLALIEIDVPTHPTGGTYTRINGNFSDFQGTVKKDDGSGNEITQNAIYNLGNIYTNMFTVYDGDIATYSSTITVGTTEN